MDFSDGKLKLIKATEEQLILEDGKGTCAVPDFLTPNKLNVGLGFQLCLSGNQILHPKHTLAVIRFICKIVPSTHMVKVEVMQAMYQ